MNYVDNIEKKKKYKKINQDEIVIKPAGQKTSAFDIFIYIFFGLFSLIIFYPFLNAVYISIIPEADYIRNPFILIPKNFDFSSYVYVFKVSNILDGMKVTIFVTIVGLLFNMVLTVMTAFALTKEFFGKKIFTYAIIFTLYFSGGMIPTYLLIKNLGLIDSLFSMILPSGITFMYMTVISRFFLSLPHELQESAKMDGANELTILFKVILPLSLPILATFALYYGVDRWNEWYNGMLYMRSPEKLPLQLILRNIYQSDSGSDAASAAMAGIEKPFTQGITMACTVVSIIPILLLYPFLQKYFVSGLTTGGVKG